MKANPCSCKIPLASAGYIEPGESNQMNKQTGFTLIELMLVVAIIGILATIAVPAYQNYTIRTQVTEGLNLAAEIKTAIGAFNSVRGGLPDTNEAAGVASAESITGNYVTKIEVGDGGITITYGGDRVNEKIKNGKLGLSPIKNTAGGLIWVCGKAASPLGGGPTAAAGITNIDPKYLPADCRP